MRDSKLVCFCIMLPVGSVHMLNVMELSINDFVEQCPTYTGAHLIFDYSTEGSYALLRI